MHARMRVFVLALVFLIMVTSAMAANGRSFMIEMRDHEHRHRILADGKNTGYDRGGSSVNGHHYIPRQDFNNFGGDGGKGGSSG